MKQDLQVELGIGETTSQAMARIVTSPECLSASVLTICQNIDQSQINEMTDELRKQTSAVHGNDLTRIESMLSAQAHTLDGLFARLATNALTSTDLNKLERYMKLALKAQSQSRATLQTLAEMKAPKQIAFVRQANIGNQVHVNNDNSPSRSRTEKIKKEPSEVLEIKHGERLDAREAGSASRNDSAMASLGAKHRSV